MGTVLHPGDSLVLDVDDDLHEIHRVRALTDDAVASQLDDRARYELLLVVSELVTNALIHGHPPVRVSLAHAGDEVVVEVYDASAREPRPRPPGRGVGGYGLHLLDELADRWGTAPRPPGKCVWCRVPLGSD